MPILRFAFTLFLFLCFIWAVFILSWYVALPLLIICVLFGSARWLYTKFLDWRYRGATNGCQIHKSEHTPAHTTIIDADYTELP